MTATMTTSSAAAPARSKSLGARIVGVFFAPRATYAAVAARPRILGMMAFVIGVVGIATFTFLSTDAGQRAALDNQVRQMESFGRTVTDAQYERMEAMASYARYVGAASQVIAIPLLALVVSGLAFAVFNAALGCDATFKQVYAIAVHSGAILTVQALFGLPLAYARESLSSATSLAVFFPFLDENSFPARLAGSIDLFLLWWIMSFAIGLGVLYRKRTGPIAVSLIVVYVTIGVFIAVIKTAFSGV
jgi:Yip1-like protein